MSTEVGTAAEGAEAQAPPRPPALSPSRAVDFRRCALLYRFRAVDRLPEIPSPGALRGTVVHAVLERLHGLDPEARRPEAAQALTREVLDELDPALRALLGADPAAGLDALTEGYFALEDPRTVTSEGRELRVEAELADPDDTAAPTPLRGYLDRLDAGPDGLMVVDYKSGPAPSARGELRALFGVRCYALLIARTRGVVPAVRLLHLGNATTLTLRPTPAELDRFAGVLRAVWAAIRRAAPTGDFRPNPGPGCTWCEHRVRCPAWGGTPPPYPGWPGDDAPVSLPVPLPRPPPPLRRTDVTVTEPFFRLLPPAPDGADPPGAQRVLATKSTAGPWFPDGQHMGPPGALLVRALERCEPRDEMLLSRFTVEVLGRVPMGELTVSARVERPGRTIELVSAEIAAEGRAVARAAGWRLAVTDTAAAATDPGPPLPGPEQGREIPTPAGWLPGYLDAVEWRWLRGHLGESGPGQVWGRLRVPVVDDEVPTPWQRLAAIADSTNGTAARLDLNAWLFVNTDLTLHVHRAPQGEWIGLDADSVIGPEGLGTAFSVLHDDHGPVGRAAQALTVRPR